MTFKKREESAQPVLTHSARKMEHDVEYVDTNVYIAVTNFKHQDEVRELKKICGTHTYQENKH